jgi:hypothetical protein
MGNDEVFRQLHRNPFRHQPFHFLRWRHWFEKSQDLLAKLADEALAEDQAGLTKPF